MANRGQRYIQDGVLTPPPAVVKHWPVYLLKRIPPELRDNLAATAEELNWSVADVIRDTLCQHYRLDCPPRSRANPGTLKPGTTDMVLRLQPELWRSIQDDKKISERPIRTIVIEAIQKRYEREETP